LSAILSIRRNCVTLHGSGDARETQVNRRCHQGSSILLLAMLQILRSFCSLELVSGFYVANGTGQSIRLEKLDSSDGWGINGVDTFHGNIQGSSQPPSIPLHSLHLSSGSDRLAFVPPVVEVKPPKILIPHHPQTGHPQPRPFCIITPPP